MVAIAWSEGSLAMALMNKGTLHLGTFTSSTANAILRFLDSGISCNEVSKEPGGVEFRVVNQSNQSSQLTMYDDGFLRLGVSLSMMVCYVKG